MSTGNVNWAGDYSRDLLRNGMLEARAGNLKLARLYLDRALYMSLDHEVMAEAWYWMSRITEDPAEKRKALENCLANDLQHARARRALAILDGKLKPDEIVNPDALPRGAAEAQQVRTDRFMCPKCGGRMSYAPDGRSLECEYCRRSQAVMARHNPADEGDFIVAMATKRGHGKPLQEQVIRCQGCSAEFILPAGQLSVSCAYCGSPHVVNLEHSKELVAPDGIVPHAFDQKHAADVLADWVEARKIEPEHPLENPRGLYLPIWTFEFGGGIDYVGDTTVREDESPGAATPAQIRGRYPVLRTVSVAASRKPSAPFVRLIPTFELQGMQPYDARYLAAWPAELYDVSMADASLEARSLLYENLKRDLPALVGLFHLISTSSAKLTIQSFRLDLLPVWMSEVWVEGRGGLVLINGQMGTVQGDALLQRQHSRGGLREWLAELLND